MDKNFHFYRAKALKAILSPNPDQGDLLYPFNKFSFPPKVA